ncbi:MAG TPA: tetratricopeptide repeat protein [Candidatus Baltobacteraceae bacterium]|jgi:tetratricopeptide (TPR) repeat protein|nr:tetratricopeptide repeat protein [Candidatus Baltobacteraceae bacterium]
MPGHKAPLSRAWLLPAGFGLAAGIFLLLPPRAAAQSLEETQREFLRGHYDAVIKTATEKAQEGDYRGDWRVLLVKTLLTVGRYNEAHTNALAALADYSGNLEMRLLARTTSLFQGDRPGADLQLMEARRLIERRAGAFDTEEAPALGQALLLLGLEPRLVLENCFRRAETMEPPLRDAFIDAGQLALDKHDFVLAADTFRAGLKKFPDDPDMEGGLAAAFQTGDPEEMMKAIQAALAVNPRHVPSLLLLADHLIDAEQYDLAAEQLARVLEVNPHQPEALAYRSVLAQLHNDPAAAGQFRAEALKYWTTNPQVDYIIGLKLAQKYRFAEAAAEQRRALEFDQAYLPARRELAGDLLRLGQDDQGWALAQEVHSQDDYDITSYNLVKLHDQMEKFQTLTNANFIVQMSAHEAALYGDRVLDLLGRARDPLCRKYGVELTQRTTVDIFPDQKDFAVRTFGMPGNPGYLGVCFGSVITANSPASQAPNPANWEDVLWHEFCHVVTLTLTRNRMPRWLSEGISVYEERQANPAWGERMSLAYRDMILTNALTPLGELSGAFLTAKNSRALQFAYYESSLVVEFVVQQYGLDTLKAILGDLRDGSEINHAIAAHTAPLPDLEKRFAAFARDKALNLAPEADLQKPPEDRDGVAFTVWEKAHPHNYYLTLEHAEKLIDDKNWADAKPVLELLAASYHGERLEANPLWLLALTERNLKETNAELATLQQFAAQETDFADLYLRLIDLCGARQDWPDEIKYAQLLLEINPLITAPYSALAEAGAASGKTGEAIDAYRKLLLLDPPDPAEAHYQLARLLHAQGGSESEAKRQVLQALEEAPRFREAQRLLLQLEDHS